jgi:hypothetical protein
VKNTKRNSKMTKNLKDGKFENKVNNPMILSCGLGSQAIVSHAFCELRDRHGDNQQMGSYLLRDTVTAAVDTPPVWWYSVATI